LSLDASRRSNYCDAMRYFFHIVGGSELFPDELGRSLPTLESAKRHAKVLADELRTGGDFYGSSLVRVVDEDGNTVFECGLS
jgi:uncharacterized protein DUF6894